MAEKFPPTKMDFNWRCGSISCYETILVFGEKLFTLLRRYTSKNSHQYIKDSKVEICRGGRSTIAVEAIAVETIAVEVITVEMIAVEAIAVHPGGVN